MSKKVLVTGGCGYIGSHTIVELIKSGYEVLCLDDNSRSKEDILIGVEKITGVKVNNHKIDLADIEQTESFFAEYGDNIESIIHFAAYKFVGESVQQPYLYFRNNLDSLNNILLMTQRYKIRNFIFSSSCTVYGKDVTSPLDESLPFGPAESPYGRTKQIGEGFILDYHNITDTNYIPLRYFNPVGAHPSGLIGNASYTRPESLAPFITQVAAGKLDKLIVFGNDYNTKDGTPVRDYIHVSDIADAHVKAIEYLNQNNQLQQYEVFNLGTGHGSTVLEVISAFEKANGIRIPYEIGARRPGDLEEVYASNKKAKELLKWESLTSLEECMRTEWEWGKRFYLS